MNQKISMLFLYDDGNAGMAVVPTIERFADVVRERVNDRKVVAISGNHWVDGHSFAFERGPNNSRKDLIAYQKAQCIAVLKWTGTRYLTVDERIKWDSLTNDEKIVFAESIT